jgi:hypothetical protein
MTMKLQLSLQYLIKRLSMLYIDSRYRSILTYLLLFFSLPVYEDGLFGGILAGFHQAL